MCKGLGVLLRMSREYWYPPSGLKLLGSQNVPSFPVGLLSPPFGEQLGAKQTLRGAKEAVGAPLWVLRVGGSLGPSRPSEGLRLLFLGNT